jgi:osmoprotectant transport system substrate-binding protein
MTRWLRRTGAAALALVAALALTACGGGSTPPAARGAAGAARQSGIPPIRLGTKNFTEQYILGEIYAQILRGHGFDVELKSDVGSSEITHAALTIGSLDMYPEYTGVLVSEIAGEAMRPPSAAASFREAAAYERAHGNTLLAPTPFSDSNALAVKPAFAKRHHLHTIADLANVPGGASIGAPPEFGTRFEGLVGLRQLYGLSNLQLRRTPIGKQYAALDRGDVDVAAVFSTDGQLAVGQYVVLRDPKNLFSFQNVAPVIKQKVLTAAPGIANAIDAVNAKLTTTSMQQMNAAVDLKGEKPAAVARRFLRRHGLI